MAEAVVIFASRSMAADCNWGGCCGFSRPANKSTSLPEYPSRPMAATLWFSGFKGSTAKDRAFFVQSSRRSAPACCLGETPKPRSCPTLSIRPFSGSFSKYKTSVSSNTAKFFWAKAMEKREVSDPSGGFGDWIKYRMNAPTVLDRTELWMAAPRYGSPSAMVHNLQRAKTARGLSVLPKAIAASCRI